MIVGIDPGLKGAIAFLECEHTSVVKMPVGESGIDARALHAILSKEKPLLVGIEKVHAMPKQGVSSTFTFGKGYGAIIAVLEVLMIPYLEIMPQTWKKSILAGTARDKESAIAYCTKRWPHVSLVPEGARKPSDGFADALCIAEYTRGKQ